MLLHDIDEYKYVIAPDKLTVKRIDKLLQYGVNILGPCIIGNRVTLSNNSIILCQGYITEELLIAINEKKP